MADEREQPDQMEPLGPEYEALQRRLLTDGTVWRARLPSTERLERRLDVLTNQERAAHFRAAGARQSGRLQLLSQLTGGYTVFQGRIRTALALTTVAVVVVLFAVLFYGFVGHKAGNTASPGGTQTTIVSQPTNAPAQHQYGDAVPAVAPGNPNVVYKLVPGSGSSGQLVLARSTDGGATWKTFALPSVHGGSAPTPQVVFVSPLNPQYVFLTVTVDLPSGDSGLQPCPQSITTSGVQSYVALSGGSPVCAVEFLSRDGGAHWSLVHLPASAAPAALGDTSGYVFPTFYLFSNGTTVFHVQGNRLYSTTNVEPGSPPNYPETQSTATIRIVVSTDGGLNWSYADDALASKGTIICDYAATPDGSTLFAVTAAGCNSEAAPSAFLWRSDDAGAHWTVVGRLPDNAEMGMIAVSRGSGQTPLLYINMAKETCTTSPYISRPRSGSCGLDASPANLQVSANGGKTWTAAPTRGFPTGQPQSPGMPLGVLNDGSVLFLASMAQDTDGFYTWKLGETSWHHVGPNFTGASSAFVVPGAKNVVCVVTGHQSNFAVSTFSV
ncbi:MAG TPA: sialidase family protein [Ktedonobacterales bacterium]|jgi:hypothetical protein